MHRLTHMFNLRTDARKLIFSLKSPKKIEQVLLQRKENSQRKDAKEALILKSIILMKKCSSCFSSGDLEQDVKIKAYHHV